MEIDEIGGLDKRAIVFGIHYDTTLPLSAMQVISGHGSRRGQFVHQYSSFYGDELHKHLPSRLFLWLDEDLEMMYKTMHNTVFGFVSLLKNLLLVVL